MQQASKATTHINSPLLLPPPPLPPLLSPLSLRLLSLSFYSLCFLKVSLYSLHTFVRGAPIFFEKGTPCILLIFSHQRRQSCTCGTASRRCVHPTLHSNAIYASCSPVGRLNAQQFGPKELQLTDAGHAKSTTPGQQSSSTNMTGFLNAVLC